MPTTSKVSRTDNAYDRLKDEILTNALPAGFQATEPEIAERLEMSRTPVREALIRLQGEGLVELIPRRGARVLPIAPNDMRDIYHLLTILEPEAAAAAARAGLSEKQIAALKLATDDMEQALEANDLDAWAAADDLFHRLLLDCSENARLTAFVNTLFDQAHRARIVTLRLRDVPRRSTQEHRAILQAIQAGDAVRTQTLFRAHRERAARELLELLERTRLAQL